MGDPRVQAFLVIAALILFLVLVGVRSDRKRAEKELRVRLGMKVVSVSREMDKIIQVRTASGQCFVKIDYDWFVVEDDQSLTKIGFREEGVCDVLQGGVALWEHPDASRFCSEEA